MSEQTRSHEADIDWDQAAADYCRRLPLEHFMEAVTQATQRKIFGVAGDLVHLHRPDVQTFSELLIQWLRDGRRTPIRVVPDNMVVVWHEPIEAKTSFNLPKQPVGPFWVLEYVSKSNERKDYEDSFEKYENELKVPYCLIFHTDNEELTLYKHNGEKYVKVPPNESGRFPVPELEMEVALLDGWARFWFRGKLLPNTAELQQEISQVREELDQATRECHEARAELEVIRAELQRLRAELS